jgi:hypothetical protein
MDRLAKEPYQRNGNPGARKTIHSKICADMAHSYAQNHIHLVFSTKERAKLISKELQRGLWAYIAGICKNQDMLPLP